MAKKERRFIKTEQQHGMAVFVDSKTGVNYLFAQAGYGAGLCVLVDREGKPIVTPVPRDQE